MKILLAHNFYQRPGGEDTVVRAEIDLLRSRGHEVETYFRSNDELSEIPPLTLACATLWSARTIHDLANLIARFQPDVIHTHNTFPLISPSLYWAASRAGVPVVQTLHNFRLFCLNALFLREGKVCEECLGKLPWRGIAWACYRSSRAAGSASAVMLALHRALGTYCNKVTRYIALNEFCRNKCIEAGLPAERVAVKPNFIDCETGPLPGGGRKGLLFVGRLSAEKGLATLAEAKRLVPGAPLRIAGGGPQGGLLDGEAGVTRLGNLPKNAVRQEMSGALALVVPSIWYETFGLVVVEAFACGLPVIASRIGALAEIVREGETGLLFAPGNPRDLADKMTWALAHPAEMRRMGQAARQDYEHHYTPERNYRMLMDIYNAAIAEVKGYAT